MHHQLSFRSPEFRLKAEFGGALLKGNAREKRPISTTNPLHVVLRSSQAHGDKSLLKKNNSETVRKYLKKFSKQFGVTIYQFANVGNHLHLIIKVKNRRTYTPFIRSLSGAIAITVSGSNKLKALKTQFWDFKPWSRVVNWRRGYEVARDTVVLNRLAALGMLTAGDPILGSSG